MAALDYVWIVLLFGMTFSSIAVEGPTCLGAVASPDSPYAMMRYTYDWTSIADRLYLAQPRWVWCANCIHAFFFGPVYFSLAIMLIRGSYPTWFKSYVLITMSAKLYAGTLYIWANMTDDTFSPGSPALFLLQSSSYMIVPLALILKVLSFNQPQTNLKKAQ